MEPDLKTKLSVLEMLEIQICLEEGGPDEVRRLFQQPDPQKGLEQMEELKKSNMLTTIDCLMEDPTTYKGKTFYAGDINAEKLFGAADFYDLFARMRPNDRKKVYVAHRFCFEFLKAADVPIPSSIPNEYREEGEKDDEKRYDAALGVIFNYFRILAQDFRYASCDSPTGEWISADKLLFLFSNQVLKPLMDKPEHVRRELIPMIFHGQYPFTNENRAEWPDEISAYHD